MPLGLDALLLDMPEPSLSKRGRDNVQRVAPVNGIPTRRLGALSRDGKRAVLLQK